MPIKKILNNVNAGVLLINADLEITYTNDWLAVHLQKDIPEGVNIIDFFNLNESEASQLKRKIKTVSMLGSPSFTSAMHDHYLLPIKTQNLINTQFEYMQQEASIFPYDLEKGIVGIAIYDETSLMKTQAEITKQKENLQEVLDQLTQAHSKLASQTELIEKRANYDVLTDLPNRTLLKERCKTNLISCKQQKNFMGMLYIDLDRFKPINDHYGVKVGDGILKSIANQLKELSREQDTVARLSADEFVVLYSGIKDISDIGNFAEMLVYKIKESREMMTEGGETEAFSISASIGISIYPNDGDSFQPLLQNASIALENSKKDGGNISSFFTQNLNETFKEELFIERALQEALSTDNHGLAPYYQPKYSLKDHKTPILSGSEALIRWIHPEHGFIPPDKFIPIAEKAGLVTGVTRLVLKNTCAYLEHWLAEGYDVPPISVNIAAQDIADPTFPQFLTDTLNTYKIIPEKIELEITERVAVDGQSDNFSTLHQLKELGFKLSIDDFGTGYSSLSCLSAMPIDILKIDKSFVDNYSKSVKDRRLLKSIVGLAKGFNLGLIAEGVEDERIIHILDELDCELFQGYFFSKPLTAQDFHALIQKELEPNQITHG